MKDKVANREDAKHPSTAPGYGAWISVEERLPGFGERVITLMNNEYYEGNRILINVRYLQHGQWAYGTRYCHPTHWMPLPDAP